jgi:hypothetical protein
VEYTRNDVGKVLAFIQDTHAETRQVGGYVHFPCAGCGQPVGRSAHMYPPMMAMKCYQSGCMFSHKWIAVMKYLAYVAGMDEQALREKLERSGRVVVYVGDLNVGQKRASEVTLPPCLPITVGAGLYADKARKYLQGRGFDLDYLWGEFSLTYTQFENNGRGWDQRIIVPFKSYEGELVYFQGRDYSGTSTLRWNNPKNEDTPKGKSEVIYNEQALLMGGNVFVCEGAGDVWELHNAVGVAGKEPSPVQLSKMTRSNAEAYYIAFDSGTYLDSLNTAFVLLATDKPIYIVYIAEGDANEVGREKVMELAEQAIRVTYDNWDEEHDRVEHGEKGKTFRGTSKNKVRFW